ncbi:Tetraacyldisaccharide 4'-kinase [Hyphomicrobiales bacterium]|nr:Tetraacyldisaccharide 4'-kinase [Hyphomicrobiales bacterium]CAH1701005.1 Tetraacyldisaccharide 4'-kinase [Hyphomicrobiales bacterium]CAI0344883.1 Tetraacyldisaccharide 4'-kinase [Hyphomicrobiales bacterium]
MPRAPRFWWQSRPSFAATLLRPLGWLYGTITLRRMCQPGAELPIPVICVGNFVAGGAGKTPTAIAIAGMLEQRGQTPFVLMRGYGGRLAGPVEVDPNGHAAADVGDEPMLMARHARTVIARDRLAGARLAHGLGASVIVMDDGLQNPTLAKRLTLAVVDGMSGVGNGLCLPAGPLRAPLAAQLSQTDAVIVIGEGEAGEHVAAAARSQGRPVIGARLEPSDSPAQRLKGREVLALSGIGRPGKFTATLRELGATIATERAFGDHHAYTDGDVAAVIAEAKALGTLIATTEKDWTKLGALWPAAERDLVVVLPVRLVFTDPQRIENLMGAGLTPARPGAA